jgi:hypothetical protein
MTGPNRDNVLNIAITELRITVGYNFLNEQIKK